MTRLTDDQKEKALYAKEMYLKRQKRKREGRIRADDEKISIIFWILALSFPAFIVLCFLFGG